MLASLQGDAARPRESGHTSWWSALGRRAWRQPARWASAGTGLSWPKPPANWGLAAWRRVVNYRLTPLRRHPGVLVTARLPCDELFLDLEQRKGDWSARGVRSVQCAGDAWAPTTIAGAVWAGRRYAEDLDAPGPPSRDRGYRREYTAL